MTIRTIDIDSNALQAGAQIRTNDGKLVTLKHVCVEAPGLATQAEACASGIHLGDLRLGQKVRTKRGKILIFSEKVTYPSPWPYRFNGGSLSYTPEGFYSSHCGPDPMDIVEILPFVEERVRLDDVRVGDGLRLRNGERVEVIQLSTSSGGNKQTTAAERSSYWFYDNGERVNDDRSFDVVEWIPAPKPSLADRVFAQASKVDKDTIDEVAISTSDYTQHYGTVQDRLRELGSFRLLHSTELDSGKFEIRFK
jgi:hypothetical protein